MRKTLLTGLWFTTMLACLFGAYSMHKSMDEEVPPTVWNQSVITVDDADVAQAAQAWNAPVEIVYSATDADVTVEYMDLSSERIQGDAQTFHKGDNIVSCHMRLDPNYAGSTLMLHEFGHCLGLHHAEPESLMGTYAGSRTITETDRKNLARLYGN